MAKKNELGFIQQKGFYNLVGKVNGVGGKFFFSDGITKTKKTEYKINFGIETDLDGNKPFIGAKAYSDVDAYFYSKDLQNTLKKPFKERVSFTDTKEFKDGKYQLINGMTYNLGDKKEDTQNNVNAFDAIKSLSEMLQNEIEVRAIGDIEYNTYINKNKEKVSSKNFVLKKLYKSSVDMTKEDFVPTNDFKQSMIYIGIEKVEVEKGETPFFEVSALIMGRSTLDKATFRLYNPKIAMTIKKNIKEFTAVDVFGKIVSRTLTEESNGVDDGWGEKPESYKVATKRETYLEITSLDKDTLDTESYPKDKMLEILANQKCYGEVVEEVVVSKKEDVKKADEGDFGTKPTSSFDEAEDDFEW